MTVFDDTAFFAFTIVEKPLLTEDLKRNVHRAFEDAANPAYRGKAVI